MNKKCCECNLEATVQLVSIGQDGCMSQFGLCEAHAKERGIYEENTYFIADGLHLKATKKLLSNNCCPICGAAQEWVQEHKRFGCPHCREFFQAICKDWTPGFKEITLHFGKIPSHHLSKAAFAPRIDYWQQQMQTYTDSEDFEHARTCKRHIQTLKRNQKLWDK